MDPGPACPACGDRRHLFNVADLYRSELSDDVGDTRDESIDAALEDIFPRGLPSRPRAAVWATHRLTAADVAWIVWAGFGWGGAIAIGLVLALYVPEFGFAPLGFGVFLGLLVFGLLYLRDQRPVADWPPREWRDAYYCPHDRVLFFAGDERSFPPGHLVAQLK